MVDWPVSLEINAWTGEQEGASALAEHAPRWVERGRGGLGTLWGAPGPSLSDPTDPEVGWGLVLPMRQGGEPEELSGAGDAPEPIQQLLAHYPGAPVLRYDAETWSTAKALLRHDGGRRTPLVVGGGERGTAPGRVPRYLLLYGSPEEIPWSVQFVLNAGAFVGRLDLRGELLANYVSALLNDWGGHPADPADALLWSPAHDAMTRLMCQVVARPVEAELKADADVRLHSLLEAHATRAELLRALALRRPAVVVTVSHGWTSPIDKPAQLAPSLGAPVDGMGAVLSAEQVLESWEPAGAIWYAHACCSAGTDSVSRYAGLVAEGSPVDRVLLGLTALGASTTSFARSLLGATRPLRAFVGHVEPTFDWTLREPRTKQWLTSSIREAVCRGIYSFEPVGRAFARHYAVLASIFSDHHDAMNDLVRLDTAALAASLQLTAYDRQGLVILGDPAVALGRPAA